MGIEQKCDKWLLKNTSADGATRNFPLSFINEPRTAMCLYSLSSFNIGTTQKRTYCSTFIHYGYIDFKFNERSLSGRNTVSYSGTYKGNESIAYDLSFTDQGGIISW